MNLYKIKKWLFGWDYVLSDKEFTKGNSLTRKKRICRVILAKDKRVVYWNNGTYHEITDPKTCIWLTCHPSKCFLDYDFDKENQIFKYEIC